MPLYMKVAPMVRTVPAANIISKVMSSKTRAESAVVRITEIAVPFFLKRARERERGQRVKD